MSNSNISESVSNSNISESVSNSNISEYSHSLPKSYRRPTTSLGFSKKMFSSDGEIKKISESVSNSNISEYSHSLPKSYRRPTTSLGFSKKMFSSDGEIKKISESVSNSNISEYSHSLPKSYRRPTTSLGFSKKMSLSDGEIKKISDESMNVLYTNSCIDINKQLHNSDDTLKSPRISTKLNKKHKSKSLNIYETCQIECNNNTLINQYYIGNTIGKGQSSIVKKIIDTDTHKVYAMKIIKKNKLLRNIKENNNYDDQINLEISILHKISCFPYCVQLHEVLYNKHYNEILLIMEYCSGGPIIKLNNNNDFTYDYYNTWTLFRQLIIALDYLHFNDIIHLDLKPDNILLDEFNNIKVADFGISQILKKGSDLIINTKGTPAFYSPELCNPKSINIKGKPVDVWAAGVILYCLIYGKIPFKGPIICMFADIINKPIIFDKIEDVYLEDLLKKLLEKDPEKRITIDQLKKHTWITNNGKLPLYDHQNILKSYIKKNIIKPFKKNNQQDIDL